LSLEQWPVVFTKFDGEHTLRDVEEYIEAFKAVHAKNALYANVTWLKRYASGRENMQRVARWMKDAEEHTRTYCVGTAMVTQAIGFRFVLSSIFLLRPMVTPYVVCGTVDEALAFVQHEGRRRKMPLPATLKNPWPDAP